ncbi:MAG: nucleotidyltransferase domain-containing protein [Bacteroidota bacterium]
MPEMPAGVGRPPLVDVVREVLTDVPSVALAILYGSTARGTETAASDLDLAVTGRAPLSVEERIDLIRALGSRTGRAVDLVELREANGALLSEVFRTGIRVVETDRSVYPALLARHLRDEADWRPIRDRILTERRRAWIEASS